MNKIAKTTVSTIMATSLLLTPVMPNLTASAATTNKTTATAKPAVQVPKAFAGTKLKTFMISSKSYIQIKDVYFLTNNQEKTVHYTLSVYNGDSRELDMIDYWSEILATGGMKYRPTASPTNPKSMKVASNTTREYSFYSKVNVKLNYSDLTFRLLKWDFNMPNYERALGSVKITNQYQNVVPNNYYYVLRKDNEKLKTSVSQGASLKMGTQKQVQLNYTIENIGFFGSQIPNYQFYLKTKQGYTIKLNASYEANKLLSPNEKLDIPLSTKLNSTMDVTGAQLVVTRLDEESKLEIPVALYATSWGAYNNGIVPSGKASQLNISNNKINAYIENVFLSNQETTNELSISLALNNKGTQTIKLPKYKYEILTEDGARYPVNFGEAELELAPEIRQEITGTANLPINAKDNFVLVITQPAAEDSKTQEYMVSAMRLPAQSTVTDVSKKTYQNAKGKYQIGIDRVERLPYNDQDLVNVYLEIKNIGQKMQEVPNITGVLAMSGLTLDESKTKLIKLDNSISIAPNETTRYVISAKVPYTYKYSDLKLTLNETLGEDKKKSIGVFTAKRVAEIPVGQVLDSIVIDSVGRRSEATVEQVQMFESENSKLLYIDLNYVNKEIRYSTLPVLKAYIRTKNKDYLEAKVLNNKNRISPNGNSSLIVTAVVPKNFDPKDIQLILGEAMKDGQYSTIEGEPDSYINAKGLRLSEVDTAVNTSLKDIFLHNYSLTINDISSIISEGSTLKVNMKYDLKKLNKYESDETKRKLIVEVTDGTYNYEATPIEIEQPNGLKAGEKLEYSVELKGTYITSVMYRGYDLNIYEEYEGNRRLLATKKVDKVDLLPIY
ncbi:hypothetical protein [Paenibacillus mendelii]|uniref:Uncharacterized protein n=1 Tax=Paenibacillus mendelii TaxID=206163 RepID=A0ABV6J3H3_9BACL|nr:hypothetical protein [Paenibacillus mendelii]MCQ6561889.1 hypothetical protein [Paenibacillus mendelii]